MSKVYFIHDFDNCLVAQTKSVLEHIFDVYVKTALEHGSPLGYEGTCELMAEGYKKFGLVHPDFAQYGIDIDDLYLEVHRRLLKLAQGEHVIENYQGHHGFLGQQNFEHCILSHGTTDWVKESLEEIGLDQYFSDERIIGLDKLGMSHSKIASQKGFEQALSSLGLTKSLIGDADIYFLDDSIVNHRIPYEMGLKTVHITPMREGEHLDTAPHPHVHHRFACIGSFFDTFERHSPSMKKTFG